MNSPVSAPVTTSLLKSFKASWLLVENSDSIAKTDCLMYVN